MLEEIPVCVKSLEAWLILVLSADEVVLLYSIVSNFKCIHHALLAGRGLDEVFSLSGYIGIILNNF